MRRLLAFVSLIGISGNAICDEKLEGIACRSVHFGYRDVPAGVAFYNEVQVEQSAEGTYFCVCGFGHGYFGIQELRRGAKVIIFSVWDPGKQNNPEAVEVEQRVKLEYQGESVRVKRFGNEGTGGQSFYDFDWKPGRRYQFLITAELKEKRTAYSGWIYLPEEERWFHMVTFSTLANGDLLGPRGIVI